MQRKFLLLGCLMVVLSGGSLFAQVTAEASANAKNAFPSTSVQLEINDEDWSFFLDEENKLCFIDFETLKVNLSDIVVKDKSGEVIFEEDVFTLPVNTIYEIDFNKLGSGEFDIELRSFTGTMRKSVTIR